MTDWTTHPYMPPALDRVRAAFDGVQLHGGWRDPFADHHLIVLVAYDRDRMAGIRRVREQFETHFEADQRTINVTAYECAYFARLIARGIGRAVVCALGTPVWDARRALADLEPIARLWWDAQARDQVGASGLTPPTWLDDFDVAAPSPAQQQQRFDRLDEWVVSCR